MSENGSEILRSGHKIASDAVRRLAKENGGTITKNEAVSEVIKLVRPEILVRQGARSLIDGAVTDLQVREGLSSFKDEKGTTCYRFDGKSKRNARRNK